MRSLKIIYAVFCSLLVMGCCLSASGVNVYDTSKDARSVIGDANYDSSEEGTPPAATKENAEVDGINVVGIHTGRSVMRYASFNTGGSFIIYPNSKLTVKYKFVRAGDSTTDPAILSSLRPVIAFVINDTATFRTVASNEGLVENEWSEYTFDVGKYVAAKGTLNIRQLRPLGVVTAFTDAEISENGLKFGGTFDKTRQHVCEKDAIYISEISTAHENFTVTLDANGGTFDITELRSEGGLPVILPNDVPVKDGYKFIGWSLKKNIFDPAERSFVPQSDMTLYAVYNEANIAFQSRADGKVVVKAVNSGITSIPCGTLEKPAGQIDGYNSALVRASADADSVLSADCYAFNSSLKNTTATRATRIRVTYKYTPAENTTTNLTALLTKKPSIHVITLGGEIIEADDTVVANEWTTVEFDLGKSTKLTGLTEKTLEHIQLRLLSLYASGAPEGSSITFGRSPSVHIDPNDKLYIGEVSMVYKYDYEIGFDANGGAYPPDPEYIVSGFGVKLNAAEPQRLGYSFKGWGLTPEAAEAVIAGFVPTEDMTLYAIWESNPNYSLGVSSPCELSGAERRTITVGEKIYTDRDAVFSQRIPEYFIGREFAYTGSTEKNLHVVASGWVYALVSNASEELGLEQQGFSVLGSMPAKLVSDEIDEEFTVLCRHFTEQADVTFGASAIIITEITFPDDSLIAGEVIIKPAEKLAEHPEYSEYLNGNRKFGGCPSITETPDGRLWLSITSGGAGEDMYNYAMLYCSSDGGENWGEAVLVVDPKTPIRTSEPLTWCDPDGRLWFFWSQMYTPSRVNSDGRMGVWCMYSSDGGETWSTPVRIAHGFSNQNPIVLSDGTWMLPVNIWNNNNSHPELRELQNPTVYTSVDKGETWVLKGICKNHSASTFMENAVIELSDGRLWMTMRTNGAGVEETFSTDGGATWTDAVNAGISKTSGRTAADKLPNGNIIVVSHDDEFADGARAYLTIWLSEDDGETFPYKLLLDEVGWYPNTVVSTDGETIYITYDCGRGAGGCAMLARVTVADIKAGKLVTDTSFTKWLANKGNCKIIDKATVTFDTDGNDAVSPMTFTVTVNSNGSTNPVPFAVKVLPAAQKNGYTFDGWATVKNGDAIYAAGTNYTPSSMNETLYAVFVESEAHEVTISFTTIRTDGEFPNKDNLAKITVSNASGVVATLFEPENCTSPVISLATTLSSGHYTYRIEKNGYLRYDGEFEVADCAVISENAVLVAGDIKERLDAVCGDGKVDIYDFIRLIRGFDPSSSQEFRNAVDINEDGFVTIEDLAALKGSFSKNADDS